MAVVRQPEICEAVRVVDLPVSHLDSGRQGAPSVRFRHAACLFGSHIYLHGGRSGHRALRDFWRLDLELPSWEAIQPIEQSSSRPGLLEDHILASYGDVLLMIGNGPDCLNRSELQVWTYQLDDFDWRRLSAGGAKCQTPSGRRSATGTVVADKLYIFGGIMDLYAKPTSELIKLDLDNFSWETVGAAGAVAAPYVYEHSTIVHGGRLYVFGGMKDHKVQNTLWTFDLTRKLWSRIAPVGQLPAARRGHSAVCIPSSDSMLIHGGRNDKRVLGDLWIFHCSSEIWTEIHLSEPCFLSYHVALWIPSDAFSDSSLPEPAEKTVRQTLRLSVTEDYFSKIGYSSQERLIPEAHMRNVPDAPYVYDNEAIELEPVSSRKLVRNASASSEKRTRDTSKKVKSEEKIRLSGRSVGSRVVESAEIELDDLSRQTAGRAAVQAAVDVFDAAFIPRVLPLSRKMISGKLVLIGGESNQETVIAKQSLRIKTVEMTI